MAPSSRGEVDHPGAGTLWVYDLPSALAGGPSTPKRRGGSRQTSSSGTRSKERGRSKSSGKEGRGAEDGWPPRWEDVRQLAEEPISTISPDAMLERGIAEYTFLSAEQGGVLGRGKFSTVYKVVGLDEQVYALKHTPLHPHHPLIAARLLREPTLMAQLPPHPCVVGVEGWVRTEGHFYLVETFAASHVALPDHPLPLSPSRAAYILDQLVSATRDCLHAGRVCHRDLKGENVLIDIRTGDLVIVDLGLATHFSASEAKLTTCCGSPAFHSPEIVNALNHPPGAVTYFGPELDIWCIALTLLSLLLDTRFPLGPSHTSRHTMAARVLDRLQELDALYPPTAPFLALKHRRMSAIDQWHEASEWKRVRAAMRDFLDMDGGRRMESFRRYDVSSRVKARVKESAEQERERIEAFKQVSFVPGEVKYTLPLSVSSADPEEGEGEKRIVLANPTGESERRIMSYLKYLLRTAGILYHVIPGSSAGTATMPNTPSITTVPDPLETATPLSSTSAPSTLISTPATTPTFQLVLPLPASLPVPQPLAPITAHESSWVSNLFRRPARSASVPARERAKTSPAVETGTKKEAYLRCWVKVEFVYPHPPKRAGRRRRSTAGASVGTSSSGATMMSADSGASEATAMSAAGTSSSSGGRSGSTIRSSGRSRSATPSLRRHATLPAVPTLALPQIAGSPVSEPAMSRLTARGEVLSTVPAPDERQPQSEDTDATLRGAVAVLTVSGGREQISPHLQTPLPAASAYPHRLPLRPGQKRTASTSRLPRANDGLAHPSPLSRQVSPERPMRTEAGAEDGTNGLSGRSEAHDEAEGKGGATATAMASRVTSLRSKRTAGSSREMAEAGGAAHGRDARKVSDPTSSVGLGRGGSAQAPGLPRRASHRPRQNTVERNGEPGADTDIGKREEARVIILVSDARAVPVLRKAFDVRHVVETPDAVGGERSGGDPAKSGDEVASSSSPEVEVRGRRRSKESDRLSGTGAAPANPERNVQIRRGHDMVERPPAAAARRDVSRGRRLFDGLFGGMGRDVEERAASVPPSKMTSGWLSTPMI